LCAGGNFHAIADTPRKACFRLDIGVLDETSLECAFDDEIGGGKRALNIAGDDAPADKDVLRAARMNKRRGIGKRLAD
jgi:hypothetical protein